MEKLENGNYILNVHIADVSHYVKEDSAIDREAILRGTSVYMFDRVIPMLPVELSNGICSLNEGVERLVLGIDIKMDLKGNVLQSEVFKGIIKSAKKSIILIDNYVDESVLLMLSKRNQGVTAKIYTSQITHQLRLDLQRHHTQYPTIQLVRHTTSHDRFLIIDDTEVYHIGASLKDLGKKLFAFSKLNIEPSAII